MKKVKISIIAAISENRALGKGGKLLWHISEDMKRFKKLSEGHVVIMGRKTYESLGKPLANRMNIIVTRNKNFAEYVSINPSTQLRTGRLIDTFVVHSLEEAINLAKKKIKKDKKPLTTNYLLLTTSDDIFIIGGGQLYQQAIKYADKLYLTIVKGNFEADTFFPDYSEFKKTVFKKESKDEKYKYTFLELER